MGVIEFYPCPPAPEPFRLPLQNPAPDLTQIVTFWICLNLCNSYTNSSIVSEGYAHRSCNPLVYPVISPSSQPFHRSGKGVAAGKPHITSRPAVGVGGNGVDWGRISVAFMRLKGPVTGQTLHPPDLINLCQQSNWHRSEGGPLDTRKQWRRKINLFISSPAPSMVHRWAARCSRGYFSGITQAHQGDKSRSKPSYNYFILTLPKSWSPKQLLNSLH